MKAGAEPKKVAILVGLLAVAAYLLYDQFQPDPGSRPAAAPARTAPPARQIRSAADELLGGGGAAKTRSSQRIMKEFKPVLKRSKPGEGPDPVKLDPTLRQDLLAKVQSLDYQTAERNLFQFGTPKPKVDPQAEAAKEAAAPPKANGPGGPAANTPPAKAPPPPIQLKYYGYANRPGDTRRRALLMDGEEIFVAVEGEVLRRRYRVVRIGINSIVIEDVEFKSEQTLPLQET